MVDRLLIIVGRIPTHYRRILYLCLFASWVSGVAFYVFSRWIEVEGDFGPEKHPWQFPVLQMHGFAAFCMLLCIGAIVANHVPVTWRSVALRTSGTALCTLVGLQVISGYTLYYASHETFRWLAAEFHAINGFLMPFILGAHVLSMRNLRKERRANTLLTKPWYFR